MTDDAKIPRVEAKIVKGHAVIKCPYCRKIHQHGPYPGHRVSHCDTSSPDNRDLGYIITVNGKEDL